MTTINTVRDRLSGDAVWRAFALLALCPGVVVGGCTPTLSTMEPARLTPPGHFQITTSASGTLPTGEPMSLMRDLQRVSKVEKLSLSSSEELALGTASLLVNAPGLTANAAAAIGMSHNYELSARISTASARIGLRHQLFQVRRGFYGVVGVGATEYFAPLDIGAFSDRATIHHFSRREIDMPLHFGLSGRVAHFWGGPKLVLATYDVDVSACLDTSGDGCASHGRMRMRGVATYAGGQVGVAVGYERAWLAFELTAMHLSARADLNVNVGGIGKGVVFAPNGWLFSPALGVMTAF